VGHSTSLAEEQQRTLERLMSLVAADALYLAGGTAVAHHLGHRRSLALDLFSERPGLSLEGMRARLVASLSDVVVLTVTDAALRVRIGSTPVDIVSYPYPPLEPPGGGPVGFRPPVGSI